MNMIQNMLRLKEKYQKEVVPQMKEKFGYRNDLAVPKVGKVVINTGLGKFKQDQKTIEEIERALSLISGQKPVFTLAKKAISSFKIREGMKVGFKITLRSQRMYDFLERLIYLALPRSRDFRGIEQKSIDEKGNLTIGIKEHIIFPEISHEEVKTIFGLEISVITNVKKRKEGLELLRLLGLPIKT